MIEENPTDMSSDSPYRILMGLYENLKDYKKLTALWEKIQVMYPNDPTVKENVEKYKALIK
jgi:hypothetical protein